MQAAGRSGNGTPARLTGRPQNLKTGKDSRDSPSIGLSVLPVSFTLEHALYDDVAFSVFTLPRYHAQLCFQTMLGGYGNAAGSLSGSFTWGRPTPS